MTRLERAGTSTGSIAGPETWIILIVILIGAIGYLGWACYIRRSTAYLLIASLIAILVFLTLSMR